MEAKKKAPAKASSVASEQHSFFEPDRLKDFIRFIEDRDIAEIEVKMGESSVFISKVASAMPAVSPTAQVVHSSVPAAAPVAPAPSASLHAAPAPVAPVASPTVKYLEITAPLVGTFYGSPSPKDPPFVKVGDTVQKGQTVCIVEAMKVFNNIPSEVSGVVREICAKNEQPVEYGQVLFRVEAV
ncbi:MAG: acetyl-CoA carboxylase, biotin carboxyl carrier protein [Elusimicrobia bacterium RIFOXYB2_FULL_49_7]|nr:MAG: acetyl-CoA carboxylase, biotin carboxyl carrier protein [Elusimicrobia bacterium RIFOXYB2_FULL_49_7]